MLWSKEVKLVVALFSVHQVSQKLTAVTSHKLCRQLHNVPAHTHTHTIKLNLDSWIEIDQLDVTFFISLFNAQHVSNVSTSILRSLRLICWVISWVVLLWFDVCWCYGVVQLGWCGILRQASACLRTHQHIAILPQANIWRYNNCCSNKFTWLVHGTCSDQTTTGSPLILNDIFDVVPQMVPQLCHKYFFLNPFSFITKVILPLFGAIQCETWHDHKINLT